MIAGRASRSAIGVLGEALANRSIRRIEIAWAAGTAADWAFLVILLVVAYEQGGTVAVGILGAVRVAPAIVAAPFAATLVERFSGDRVLTAINLTRGLGALLTAGAIAAELPLGVTFALAAVVAGAGALVRPIQSALLPAFARSPGELVAANVTSSMGEGLGTFTGPLIASAVVALTGSAAASLLVAAAFGVAAAAVTGISFERAADARADREAAPRLGLRRVWELVERYPAQALVVADFMGQIFVRGVLITLTVVTAIELLDLGDTGVGLLNAAIGLGGLAGALFALGVTGGRRLSIVFVVSLAMWGLPLVLIGAWPVVVLALLALFVTGVSNALLDVSGFTLIQRGVRNEDRAAVFAVFEALLGVALLLGSLVAPLAVSMLGARGALVLAGVLLPALALLTAAPIVRAARRQATFEDRLALLRRNALFAPLPLTALDLLAESLTPVSYGPGHVLMRKGEPGDHYVLISAGEVDVSDGDRLLVTCGAGEGVGEIALLEQVPRTATVVARTDVEGYRIGSRSFLEAVAGPAAAAAAARIASARLERSRASTVT